MGLSAYEELKKNSPLSGDEDVISYVRCVSNAITNELEGSYANTIWEVNVFKDDTANAFALPGGKIGVHTGLLKVAVNQDQLATVLGHEVAHVLARHGNERVSTQFATKTGLDVVAAISGEPSPEKSTLLGLLGAGAQFGILLPYSRLQESEADLIGIDLMAKAGFDPRESVELWRNMGKGGGGQPPEFMSTHPSHSTRISDLQERMEKAMTHYDQARIQKKTPNCS